MDVKFIIGHENEISNLRLAIKNKTISHSYIFEGQEGLGKKTIALEFAKTLLCREKGEVPCNKCSSCYKFKQANHPDFKIIEPDKGLIKKSQVDELIKENTTMPFEGEKKVFIIDDSHLMNRESENALLKTLEEPSDYMHIILVTSQKNSHLPTIISRCQVINFYSIARDEMVESLIDVDGLDENKAEFLWNFTKGAYGKAKNIVADEEFFQMRDEVISLIDSILRKKALVFSTLGFFEENKENMDDILDIFTYWFRDIMIYKQVGQSKLILNKDKVELLSRQSHIKYHKINNIIDRIEETRINIKRNINFSLSMEILLLSIQEED